MDSDEPLGPNWTPWNVHPEFVGMGIYYHQCRTRGPKGGKLTGQRHPIPKNVEIRKTVSVVIDMVTVGISMRVAKPEPFQYVVESVFPIVACPFCREVFVR